MKSHRIVRKRGILQELLQIAVQRPDQAHHLIGLRELRQEVKLLLTGIQEQQVHLIQEVLITTAQDKRLVQHLEPLQDRVVQ